jgi:hypothetical protein
MIALMSSCLCVNAHWKTYFFEHRPDLQKLIIIIAAGGLSA